MVEVFAVEDDFAVVDLINSEKAFHQSRFPRAVFSQKRMNFTAGDFERNVFERVNAGEALADILHGQQWCFIHAIFILSRNG